MANASEILLTVPEKGKKLALELARQQSQRVKAALEQAGSCADVAVLTFLLAMVAPQNRANVVELIGRINLPDMSGDSDEILEEWSHAKCSNTQY